MTTLWILQTGLDGGKQTVFCQKHFSVIETEIQNNANKTVNTSVVSMLCICAADGLKFCMPTQLHLFLIRCFGVEDDYTPSSETVRLVINI